MDRRRQEIQVRAKKKKKEVIGTGQCFFIAYRRNQIRGSAEVQEQSFEVPVYDGEEREDSGFGEEAEGRSGKWQRKEARG